MKLIADKIRRIISRNNGKSFEQRRYPFDFIQSRKSILRELLVAKEAGTWIGLISPALGEGVFFVLIVSLDLQTNDAVVVSKKYDPRARTCTTVRLTVNDLTGVCPFLYHSRPAVSLV